MKPLDFIAKGKKGLLQPAVKCRGREYLRIIYGPDYTSHENLNRLRHRGLGAKRSLALRKFAPGIEALERFVRREPLRRVHECVFGVLALESEPVDPRLEGTARTSLLQIRRHRHSTLHTVANATQVAGDAILVLALNFHNLVFDRPAGTASRLQLC